MNNWFVVETKVYRVAAPTESEAIAIVEDEPDRAPVYHTVAAEAVVPPAAARRAPRAL